MQKTNIYKNLSFVVIALLSLALFVAPASAQSEFPDLEPFDLSGPNSIGTYQEMALTWTVRNNGPGVAVALSWWQDYVYFSTDMVLDAGDTLVGGFKRIQGLTAGASVSLSGNVRAQITAGTYYVLLDVDHTNVYLEGDETNNVVAFGPVIVTSPDLEPFDLSGPTSVGTYQEMALTWSVRNNGPGDAATLSWWQDYVYFSADAVLDAGDTLVGGFKRIAELAAGATSSFSGSVHSPITAGIYYVLLDVDHTNIYLEGDETNNVAVFGPVHVGNQPPTADAGGPYALLEGSAITLSGAGSDPDGDPLAYAWDFDGDGTFETVGQTPTFSAAGLDGPASHSVVLQVCDDKGACATAGATIAIANVAPIAGAITAPIAPVEVGTPVAVGAPVADLGTPDTHSAVWEWGDGSSGAGTVTAAGGNGTVEGNHTYAVAGVYVVRLTITDDDGDSDQAVSQYVVVYDPSGGFATGGGWIDSPAGAYRSERGLAGTATFGFVSRYQKGATAPTGNTQFQFGVAHLNFRSTDYEWLVVNQAGTNAQFNGSGTMNGSGSYHFMLWAGDGSADTFRIKIWEEVAGVETVVYDNGGEQPLDGGSIIIHQ